MRLEGESYSDSVHSVLPFNALRGHFTIFSPSFKVYFYPCSNPLPLLSSCHFNMLFLSSPVSVLRAAQPMSACRSLSLET